ncbi:MAG TPA: O-antigen ligase family protein [Flavipsychrobacter sp.]
MLKVAWLQHLQYILLYLLVFAIPFPFIYANIALITFAFVWVLQVDIFILWNNLVKRKVFWAYILYFFLFAVSYFYSENKDQSTFDTQSKVFMLVMPVLVGAGISISTRQLENIFLAFVLGITVVALMSAGRAYTIWQDTGDINSFFYHNIVDWLNANAVYMALYTFFTISLLLMYPWQKYFTGKGKYLKYLLTTIAIAFFILLSARMLMLLFVVFLMPLHLLNIFKTGFSRRRIVLAASVFAILIITALATDNPVKNRFKDFFVKNSEVAFLDDYSNVMEGDFNNFTLRLFLWRIGMDVVSDKPVNYIFGVGNGDAPSLLNSKMKEYGVRNIHEDLALRSPLYNANMHNMYLQSLLMVGFLGLLLLIIITFYPYITYVQMPLKPWFYAFHISTMFFMVQESMLQTQAGLAYYTLFSSIYFNLYYSLKDVKK